MRAAQAQLKASTAVYRQVIGSEPKRLSPARPIQRLLPRSLNAALGIALDAHPAIQSALYQVDQAALAVKVQEGTLYPTVTATGAVSQNFDSGGRVERRRGRLDRRAAHLPALRGGVDYSRIRQAKEQLGQARIQADVARDQVRASVVSAWGNLEATEAQIQADNAQVAASEVALSGVREEAKVGQRTTLDVLNAQQTVLNARVSLVTAQRDRVVASFTLLSAIGHSAPCRSACTSRATTPRSTTSRCATSGSAPTCRTAADRRGPGGDGAAADLAPAGAAAISALTSTRPARPAPRVPTRR